MFCAALKLFWDDAGHDLALAGVSVKLFDGTQARIFMKLAIVISDEAALHAMFACKGSSGLKPCLLCQNVYNFKNVRNVVENDSTGIAQYHTCSDWRKLQLHTPGTIRAIASRLSAAAASTMTKANMAELEIRLGWNYIPESLIFQPRARHICDLTSCVVFDWMHVFFVHGIFKQPCWGDDVEAERVRHYICHTAAICCSLALAFLHGPGRRQCLLPQAGEIQLGRRIFESHCLRGLITFADPGKFRTIAGCQWHYICSRS